MERFTNWIAWHLPRRLVRACIVKGFAYASRKYGDKAAAEITCLDAWVAV